eukprot:gene22138-18370_t
MFLGWRYDTRQDNELMNKRTEQLASKCEEWIQQKQSKRIARRRWRVAIHAVIAQLRIQGLLRSCPFREAAGATDEAQQNGESADAGSFALRVDTTASDQPLALSRANPS